MAASVVHLHASSVLGNSTASYNLGLCYETGAGVQQDLDKVRKLSPFCGYFQCPMYVCLNVISLYLFVNTPENCAHKINDLTLQKKCDSFQAQHYYKAAAECGHCLALYNLGLIYLSGQHSATGK